MEILQAWIQKTPFCHGVYLQNDSMGAQKVVRCAEKRTEKNKRELSGKTVNFCIFLMAVRCCWILEKIEQEMYKYELAIKPPLHP